MHTNTVTRALLGIVVFVPLFAQPRIALLTVEYQQTAPPPWALLCHCLPSTVSPESLSPLLRLGEGDWLDSSALHDDALRLSASGQFAHIGYRLDTLQNGVVELRWQLAPRCRHLLVPELLLGSSPVRSLGLLLRTVSLWGGREELSAGLRSRKELQIGTEAWLQLIIPLGERFDVQAIAQAHRYRTTYSLRLGSLPLQLPFYSWSGGGAWEHASGRFWNFRSSEPVAYARRCDQLRLWLSWGMQQRDALSITLSSLVSSAQTDSGYRQPFDNTILLFLGIGSLRRRPYRLPSPEVWRDLCTVTTGAWGAVTLGLSFPKQAEGERGSYLAGELEQSVAAADFFFAGRIAAGNAFLGRVAHYTVLETAIQGWLALPAPFLLAWQGRHQNVWNWGLYRAERLDVLTGFPYPFPGPTADNLMELRTELRWRGNAVGRELSWTVVLFSHLGSVWNQGTPVARARFLTALGAGLWWHAGGQTTERWSLRAEAAYVPLLRRIVPRLWVELGGTERVLHRYRFPRILGMPLTAEP